MDTRRFYPPAAHSPLSRPAFILPLFFFVHKSCFDAFHPRLFTALMENQKKKKPQCRGGGAGTERHNSKLASCGAFGAFLPASEMGLRFFFLRMDFSFSVRPTFSGAKEQSVPLSSTPPRGAPECPPDVGFFLLLFFFRWLCCHLVGSSVVKTLNVHFACAGGAM